MSRASSNKLTDTSNDETDVEEVMWKILNPGKVMRGKKPRFRVLPTSSARHLNGFLPQDYHKKKSIQCKSEKHDQNKKKCRKSMVISKPSQPNNDISLLSQQTLISSTGKGTRNNENQPEKIDGSQKGNFESKAKTTLNLHSKSLRKKQYICFKCYMEFQSDLCLDIHKVLVHKVKVERHSWQEAKKCEEQPNEKVSQFSNKCDSLVNRWKRTISKPKQVKSKKLIQSVTTETVSITKYFEYPSTVSNIPFVKLEDVFSSHIFKKYYATIPSNKIISKSSNVFKIKKKSSVRKETKCFTKYSPMTEDLVTESKEIKKGKSCVFSEPYEEKINLNTRRDKALVNIMWFDDSNYEVTPTNSSITPMLTTRKNQYSPESIIKSPISQGSSTLRSHHSQWSTKSTSNITHDSSTPRSLLSEGSTTPRSNNSQRCTAPKSHNSQRSTAPRSLISEGSTIPRSDISQDMTSARNNFSTMSEVQHEKTPNSPKSSVSSISSILILNIDSGDTLDDLDDFNPLVIDSFGEDIPDNDDVFSDVNTSVTTEFENNTIIDETPERATEENKGSKRKPASTFKNPKKTKLSSDTLVTNAIKASLDSKTSPKNIAKPLKKGESSKTILKSPRSLRCQTGEKLFNVRFQVVAANPCRESSSNKCPYCSEIVGKTVWDLERHILNFHPFKCCSCKTHYESRDALTNHRYKYHLNQLHECSVCDRFFKSEKFYEAHLKTTCHKDMEKRIKKVMQVVFEDSTVNLPARSESNAEFDQMMKINPNISQIQHENSLIKSYKTALNVAFQSVPPSEAPQDVLNQGKVVNIYNDNGVTRQVIFEEPESEAILNDLESLYQTYAFENNIYDNIQNINVLSENIRNSSDISKNQPDATNFDLNQENSNKTHQILLEKDSVEQEINQRQENKAREKCYSAIDVSNIVTRTEHVEEVSGRYDSLTTPCFTQSADVQFNPCLTPFANNSLENFSNDNFNQHYSETCYSSFK